MVKGQQDWKTVAHTLKDLIGKVVDRNLKPNGVALCHLFVVCLQHPSYS